MWEPQISYRVLIRTFVCYFTLFKLKADVAANMKNDRADNHWHAWNTAVKKFEKFQSNVNVNSQINLNCKILETKDQERTHLNRTSVDYLGPLTWTKWHSTSTLPISLIASLVLPISSFTCRKTSDANVDWGFSKTERTHPELNRRSRNPNNGTVTLLTYW